MGKCVSKNVEAEEKASKKGKSPSKSPLPKESPVKEHEETKDDGETKEDEKPVENGTIEASEAVKLEAEKSVPNGEVKTEIVQEDAVDENEKTQDSNVNVETIETEDGMIITRKSVSVKTTTVTKIVGGQIETSETTVDKRLIGCTEDELPDFIKERIASAEEKKSDVEIKEYIQDIQVSSDCEQVVADSDVVKSEEIKLENTEGCETVSS